jgi:hypothetical protein
MGQIGEIKSPSQGVTVILAPVSRMMLCGPAIDPWWSRLH